MNNRFKTSRISIVVSMMICLLFFMSTMALAAGPGKVDQTAKGSFSIKFLDSDAKPITGGNVEIFHIASIATDASGNDTYVLEKDFIGLTIDFDNIGSPELADKAETIVNSESLSGITKAINDSGIAYFDNLELGMYLITQPVAIDGWYKMSSYIATVPYNDGDKWIYDVSSIPKMELELVEVPVTTTTPETTVPVTPEVPVTVTPETTVSVTVTPEVPVTTVTPEPTVPGVSTPSPTPTIPSTSTPTPTPTPSSSMVGGGGTGTRIPQTGKLNWPIPVLSFIGAALVLTGWSIKKLDDDSYEK